MRGQGGRSLPPPVAEAGRRRAGNRKECRLRHDYASFPDSRPLWGLGQSPNVPFIIQKKKVQSQSRPLCGLRLRLVGCANWNDAPSQKRVGCTNLNDAPTASPTNPYALHTTLKYPNCSITDRQVTLRSLTAFSLIASRYRNVGGFQAGKRNSRASAPFRFQTFRLAVSPTGRARLQSPQAPSPRDIGPGNMHSRDASVAPCSSRSSASLHHPQGALGSDPTGRARL